MELKTLELNNFLAIGSATIQLDNQGLVLLEGINQDADSFKSNGAAKSTLLEGITYALYGQLSSGLAGDNVINNKIGKDTKVVLTFDILDTHYRIERYRKHTKLKNKVLLFINDEDKTQATIKNTNKLIQDLIGIDIHTYLNSIIFGQGDIKKFSESTDKEKKAILEDIASVTIYKQAQEVAKGKRGELTQKITLATQQVEATKNELNILKAQEASNHAIIKSQEENIAYAKANLETIKQKLATVTPVDKNHLEELKEKVDQAKANLDNYQPNQTLDKLTEVTNQLNTLTFEQQRWDNQDQLLKQAFMDIIKKMKTFKGSPQAVCDFCGNLLDEEHRQKEEQRLMLLYKENMEQQQQHQAANPSNTIGATQLDDLRQQKANLEQEQQNQHRTFKLLQDTYYQANNQLHQAQQDQQRVQQEYQQLLQQKDMTEKSLEQSLKVSKPLSNLEGIKSKEKDLEGAESLLEGLKHDLEIMQEVVDIYSNKGVKAHVMELITPYLTEQANGYLRELTGGTISVNLNINPENDSLELGVTNINGANDYTLNSKGEQKRIDLAIAMAMQDYVMSRSNIKPSFIGYDEVFDGLDSVGIDKIMTILKDRINVIPTIFVISHNDNLKELFENTITVIKKDGISHVKS